MQIESSDSAHPIHAFIQAQAGTTVTAPPYVPYDPAAREPVHDEIDEFFAKLFPCEDLRVFMWRLLASHLAPTNREELFVIWHGPGANGKTALMNLMKHAMCNYAGSLDASVLTRRGLSANLPDVIMTIQDKLFIYVQEPDEQAPLNTSIIKRLTSDTPTVRGKINMACNSLPPITNIDSGMFRRLCVIPFESRFVESGRPDINPEHNVYAMDRELDEKLSRWSYSFLSRLVWVYENEYRTHGLSPTPDVVITATDVYRRQVV
jgi:phage/plasmid-associated DNA primase